MSEKVPFNSNMAQQWLNDVSIVNSQYVTIKQEITKQTYISVNEVKTKVLNINSPYKGLKKFEKDDANYFFGRNQLLKSLVDELAQTNLILLLGASGSGKSSVIRAGLIPRLAKKIGSQQFFHFIFTPDHDPFESLYASLMSRYRQAEAEIARVAKEDTLNQTIKALKQPGTYWFILIDQFEELFTTSDLKKCDSFIASLVHLTKELERGKEHSVKIVATMRADFLDRFSPYPSLVKATSKHCPFMAEMQSDELRLAIEQPAALHGVVLEPGLVEEITKEVQGQAGYLPLLQYTLDLLWGKEVQSGDIYDRTLKLITYRELGGVRGALQKHVDKIYESFSKEKEKQLAIERIFLKLVGIGENVELEGDWKPVRRRAFQSEFSKPLEQEMLTWLIDRNLLVSDRPSGFQEATVEIVHEILLTSWTTLNTWIKNNRQAIALRNRLNDDVRRWYVVNKDERELWDGSKLERVLELRRDLTFNQVLGGFSDRANEFIEASRRLRERRRKRTIVGLLCFSSTALVISLFAMWQWRSAERASRISLGRQLVAESSLYEDITRLPYKIASATEGFQILRFFGLHSPYAHQVLRQELPLLAELNTSYSLNNTFFDDDPDFIFTSDNKNLALVDRSLRLQNLQTNEVRNLVEINHRAVALSPNGSYAIVEGEDKVLSLWSLTEGKEIDKIRHNHGVYSIKFSPDSTYINIQNYFPAGYYTCCSFYKISNDERLISVNVPEHILSPFVMTKDLVRGYVQDIEDNYGLVVWSFQSGEIVENFDIENCPDLNLIDSDSTFRYFLVSCSFLRRTTIKIFDFKDKKVVSVGNPEIGKSSEFRISRNGIYIGVGTRDGYLVIWDRGTQDEIFRKYISSDAISFIEFSQSGKYVAALTSNMVRVFEVSTGKEIKRISYEIDTFEKLDSIAFSSDERYIALVTPSSLSRRADIQTWKVLDDEGARIDVVTAIDKTNLSIENISLSQDGRYLVVDAKKKNQNEISNQSNSDYSGLTQVFDIYSDKKTFSTERNSDLESALSLSGEFIAVAENSPSVIRILRTKDGSLVKTIENDDDPFRSYAFTKEDAYLVTQSSSNTTQLWNILDKDSLAEEIDLFGFVDEYDSYIFSNDGKYILKNLLSNVCQQKGEHISIPSILIGDLDLGADIIACFNQEITPIDFQFSKDGSLLAGGIIFSNETTDNIPELSKIKVWSVRSQNILFDKTVNRQGLPYDVVFSHDGKYLAAMIIDRESGDLLIWDLDSRSKEAVAHLPFNPDASFDLNTLSDAIFTPDNKYLMLAYATSSPGDNYMKVSVQRWLFEPEYLIQIACKRLQGNLDREDWQASPDGYLTQNCL